MSQLDGVRPEMVFKLVSPAPRLPESMRVCKDGLEVNQEAPVEEKEDGLAIAIIAVIALIAAAGLFAWGVYSFFGWWLS